MQYDAETKKVVIDQATITGMDLPADDEWATVQQLGIPATVELVAVATAANVIAGEGVPEEGDGLDDYLYFAPDGSAEPRTVYVRTTDGRQKMRIVIYRATGTAYAKEDW